MKKDYSNAYSEVLEILKYLPKKDYEKIPQKLIDLFEENSNENSKFIYNVGLDFDKQDISEDAKVILAIIYRNCWATEGQKREILQREKQKNIQIEQEKRKKYNPDKIFKKKEEKVMHELKENNYLIVQEKWYQKFAHKIKKFFNIK